MSPGNSAGDDTLPSEDRGESGETDNSTAVAVTVFASAAFSVLVLCAGSILWRHCRRNWARWKRPAVLGSANNTEVAEIVEIGEFTEGDTEYHCTRCTVCCPLSVLRFSILLADCAIPVPMPHICRSKSGFSAQVDSRSPKCLRHRHLLREWASTCCGLAQNSVSVLLPPPRSRSRFVVPLKPSQCFFPNQRGCKT